MKIIGAPSREDQRLTNDIRHLHLKLGILASETGCSENLGILIRRMYHDQLKLFARYHQAVGRSEASCDQAVADLEASDRLAESLKEGQSFSLFRALPAELRLKIWGIMM